MHLPRGVARPASPSPAIERTGRTTLPRQNAIARAELKRIVARLGAFWLTRKKRNDSSSCCHSSNLIDNSRVVRSVTAAARAMEVPTSGMIAATRQSGDDRFG